MNKIKNFLTYPALISIIIVADDCGDNQDQFNPFCNVKAGFSIFGKLFQTKLNGFLSILMGLALLTGGIYLGGAIVNLGKGRSGDPNCLHRAKHDFACAIVALFLLTIFGSIFAGVTK